MVPNRRQWLRAYVRPFVQVFSATFVVGVALAAQDPPSANACSFSGHCWAYASQTVAGSGSGFLGMTVSLRSNCLQTTSAAPTMTAHQVWQILPGGQWVEAGLLSGDYAYRFFLGWKGNDGYHLMQNWQSTPSFSTYYTAEIRRHSTLDYWTASIGPVTSSSIGPTTTSVSRQIEAGTELGAASGIAFGSES